MSDSKMESKQEETSKKDIFKQHLAALGIGVFCLIIGLPLWWKTTEVYRVSLPYSDIQNIDDSKIEYMTEIEVVWAAGQKPTASILSDLTLNLKGRLESDSGSRIIATYRVAARDAVSAEMDVLREATEERQLSKILSEQSFNKYTVIIAKPSKVLSKPLIAPSNVIFLPYNDAGVEGLLSQITHLVKDVVRESTVKKTMESAKGLRKQLPDKNSMRAVRFNSGYDITFTLIVPEPDLVNVEWDIEDGIQDYLEPLLASMHEYTHLSISSQVLYLTSIGSKPKKGNNFYYIPESELPHIINPLEIKLGSHASNNPALNFIVYIPTQGKSPLYIYDKKDQPVPNNSFLSPQWGGVMIYNVDNMATNGSLDISIDMHRVMEVFVTQLRLLLNVQPQDMSSDFSVMQTGTSTLKQWELAGWLRCRCVENLVKSSNTLKSLAQLLEEISNIVINDDIGKEVESAISFIKQSLQLLAAGQLKDAFLASKSAIEASEKAFFDPSLLENLYFPEDQKFAIYIPLFLPISIPVVTSIIQAIKYFKQKRKAKTD